MKIRTTCWVALFMVIGSMLAAQPALAQIPCGPTISPLPTLFVNWPQYGFDAKRSGCNPYERILRSATVTARKSSGATRFHCLPKYSTGSPIANLKESSGVVRVPKAKASME